MKNRYCIAGLCLLVIMLCLVSACGGGGGSTTTTSGQTTTSQATTTSGGGGGSLSDILGKWSNTGSVKYDMVMTMTGSPTMTTTMWQKNKKMRYDMTMQGMTTTTLFDMDAGVMYTYIPSMNMAMKSTFDASMMPEGNVDTSDIMNYSPNIVGTETIDGKSCTVIAYEYAGSSMTYWIWTENGFPLKMEITSGGSKTTIEYKNVDFSNIPDSIFELPSGVTITEM